MADVLLQLEIRTLVFSHEARQDLGNAESETYEAMTRPGPMVVAILQLASNRMIGQFP